MVTVEEVADAPEQPAATAQPAAANPEETPIQKAARLRREKTLAKMNQRMQVVEGVIKSTELSSKPAADAAPSTTEAPPRVNDEQDAVNEASHAAPLAAAVDAGEGTEHKPSRWEQKWQKEAAAAARREVPKEIDASLDKNKELFVEAPKATAARDQIKHLKSVEKPRAPLPLEALLGFAAVIGLAVATSRGLVPAAAVTSIMPLFVTFVALRLALHSSLRALNLAPPKRKHEITSSATIVRCFVPCRAGRSAQYSHNATEHCAAKPASARGQRAFQRLERVPAYQGRRG